MTESEIDRLRKRVRETWFTYTSAKEQTIELQREAGRWGDAYPAPDGHYAVDAALRRESEALREYRKAMRELNAAVLPLNHERTD